MTRQSGMALAAIGASIAVAGGASADLVTLNDGNASASFDTQSQVGFHDWLVDGVDHMFQQWFWARLGAAGPEMSLDTGAQTGIAVTDTNPFNDPRADTLAVRYDFQTYTVETTYVLRGGANGSGVSDVAEQIIITNTSNETLDLHFFQYADFDLNNTAQDDRVEILGGNTARQSEGGVAITETVVTPVATTFEVGLFSDTLNALNDGVATTLSGAGGPLGPGDLTWAFQWDFTLRPGRTFIISKDLSIVAIPAPPALAWLAVAALARRRRRG